MAGDGWAGVEALVWRPFAPSAWPPLAIAALLRRWLAQTNSGRNGNRMPRELLTMAPGVLAKCSSSIRAVRLAPKPGEHGRAGDWPRTAATRPRA